MAVKDYDISDAVLPRRDREAHKGDFGRCLLICGSVGFTGAPIFAARACVRSGAGLVFLGVPVDIYTVAAVKNDEAMVFPLPCTDGKLAKQAVPAILEKLKTANACLIGPGLGRSVGTEAIVQAVVRACRCPLVIDADGINALAAHIDVLDEAVCPIILTPHAGEFARLAPALADLPREEAAVRFAVSHHCTLVLKGHRTITAFADGSAVRNVSGNPGMAKGGSGDVLAGMLTAFLGQGFDTDFAVPLAVYLHGKAGDHCAAQYGEYAMTPTDMIDALTAVLKSAEE